MPSNRYNSGMNDYSERMLPKILERRPDWTELVQMNSADGEEYFEIHIPSPVLSQPVLRIESYGDELSVYWGDWHMHVWDDDDDQSELNMLFDVLESIFSEETVVACEYRVDQDGVRRWAGSSAEHPDDLTLPHYGTEWSIYSWLGTHSKTSPNSTHP